jgi:hypothetical protein
MKTLFLALLLFATAAGAQQTTYTYSGASLASACLCGGANYGAPVAWNLAGTITLANPLPYAGTVTVTPLAFSFNSDLGMFNSDWLALSTAGTYPGEFMNPPEIVFTTTAGQITGWTISLTAGLSQEQETALITDAQDMYQDIVPYHCEETPCYVTFAIGAPGTWTGPTAAQAAPAPDPLAPTVAQLQQQVAYYSSWQAYWSWQSVGTKARLATVEQLLTNANRQIAALKAQVTKLQAK